MKRIIAFAILLLSALALYADSSSGVTIYTKPGCSRCEYTINYLKKNKIAFTEYSTSDQKNISNMWEVIRSSGENSGNSVTMPVVVINSKTYFSFNLKNFTESIPSLLAGGNESDNPPVNQYFYIKLSDARNRNLGYWDQPGFPKRLNFNLTGRIEEILSRMYIYTF